MINVSNAFKTKLNNDEREFIYNIDIVLDNGTKLPTINNDKLWENTLKIEDAVSGSGRFDVGAAIIGKLTFTLNNIYDDFSQYDFNNAKVTLFIGLELDDGTVERFQKGVYYVDDPQYNGATITLECLDNMSKFDRPYSESTLVYPATSSQILRDACTKCGVTMQTYTFDNSDYTVDSRPSDNALTFREVIQWVAQISVKYCRCDVYGRLVLGWYDQSVFEKQANLSGGIFDSDTPYSTGDGANGGTFKPWNVGDDYDGGQFTDQKGFHHIYSISSMSVSTDDVVITGVKVEEQAKDNDSEQITHLSGMDGYIVSITGNKFVEYGKGQTVSNYIGSRLIGFRFRKASFSHISNPTIEAGDVSYFTDRKQNTCSILISSTTYTAGSYQSSESSAETPGKNSATRYSDSTKNYVDYRNGLKQEKSAREKALEELGERIDNAQGGFTTIETTPSGGQIYYLHNKPTLAESDIIWKMTVEAWAVSTDGGKTWNAGMTVDGDTIVRILTAVGIDANWISTGALTLGGRGEDNPYMSILDGGNVEIGRWDKNGIKADKGTIGSWIFDKYYFKAADGSSGIGFEDYIAFWAGGNIRDASFAVGKNGNASLKGDLALINDGNLRLVRDTQDVAVISSTTSLGSYSGKILNIASFQKGIGFSSGNSLAYVINGGINPGYTEKHIFYGAARFSKSARTFSYYLGNSSARLAYATWSGGSVDGAILQGRFKVEGDFSASGSKSRIVNTENYSERLQYCYEMSTPMFGDIGESILDNDGKCYIFLDDIFSETVNTDCEYQVFLQKEGAGDLWVDSKESAFFVVRGTPNLKFAWEIKVKQRDFEFERLETFDEGGEPEEKIDYESQAAQMVKKYYEDLEEMFYEESN